MLTFVIAFWLGSAWGAVLVLAVQRWRRPKSRVLWQDDPDDGVPTQYLAR